MKLKGYDSFTSWGVAVGCSIINSLSLTPYRLSGLMFVVFIEHFGIDRKQASAPIVIYTLIRSVGAPFMGIIAERFGVEETTLVGLILAAAGLGGCFFVEDIIGVSFFFGLIYGIGLTGSNSMLPVIIKKHFTKNINSANGIALGGSCLGAFIFPALAVYLLEEYGVSGTFLIIAAIILNGVPVAMLVRNASIVQAKIKLNENKSVKYVNGKVLLNVNTSINRDIDTILENGNFPQESCLKNGCSDYNSKNIASCDPLLSQNVDETISEKEFQSLNYTNNNLKERTISSGLVVERADDNNKETEISLFLPNQNGYKPDCKIQSKRLCNEIKIVTNDSIQKGIQKQSRFHSFKIFIDPSFIFIMISISLHAYVTILFWTTMIDYSRDKGISRNLEIYILMLQPLFDMFGRLGLGWVTDLGYMNLQNYSILCFGMMALSSGWVLWAAKFETMLIGALIFAVFSGAIMPVYPTLIFKCIEEDLQTMAITSRHFGYGFLVFTTSLVIGYFRENLGSYDGLYYLFIGISIFCCTLMPLMFRFSKTKRNLDNG